MSLITSNPEVLFSLIKFQNKIQTLLNDIWIEDIQITDPPTQEQFEQYGMFIRCLN